MKLPSVLNRSFFQYVLYAVLIAQLFVAIIFKSRAFILGCTGGLFFLTFYFDKLSKKGKAVLLFIWIVLLTFLTIFIKPNSSAGRLLIYKISLGIVKTHPGGIGLGNFPKEYMLYQAEYFRQGKYSVNDLLLADNTRYVFNDYLQLIVEAGILSFLILIPLPILLHYIYKRYLKNSGYLSIFFFSQILIIAIAGMFTHVFYDQLFLYYFIYCLLALVISIINLSKPIYYFAPLLSIAVFSLLIIHFLKHVENEAKFEDAKQLYLSGFKREAESNLSEFYPLLKNDPEYLSFYCNALLDHGQINKALFIGKRACYIEPNGDRYEKLGEIYLQLHQSQLAEQQFTRSMNMVPNRILPRYNLFRVYMNENDRLMAFNTGSDILKLPIKIKNSYADYLKRQTYIKMEIEKLIE